MLESVEEGDYQVALPTLSKAFAIIDKNVKRGIVHKNTAARKKSQLHLKVKKLEVRARWRAAPRQNCALSVSDDIRPSVFRLAGRGAGAGAGCGGCACGGGLSEELIER